MKILSIQVGLPKEFTYRGNSVTSGIFKSPVTGPVMMRRLNLEGDGQADLKVHGGVDKAIYAYSGDTYGWWKNKRPGDDFLPGAMGENLTIDHLPEDKIYIGDTYEVGDAIIQVSQPRYPCQKLVAKFNDPLILKQFTELNRPGVYYRVLKEGFIESGQTLNRVDQETVRVSVMDLYSLSSNTPKDKIREMLLLQSLNDQWRKKLELKLK